LAILAGPAALSVAAPRLPDLIAWETESPPFYMHDGSMDQLTIRNKVLYRFSLPIANIGDGPLELREVTHPNQTQDIYQRIYDSQGPLTESLVGSFPNANPPYGHLFLVGIAEYRLRTVTAGNGVGPTVATQVKTSYALVDSDDYDLSLPGAPDDRVYDNHNDPLLGISIGWADVYSKNVPRQWIEVTGLLSGQYWLEVEVDPYNLIQETDNSNNVTRVLVDLAVPDPIIMPGDYNDDDIVNAADYVVWRKRLGQTVAAGTSADGDGNGVIGQPDLAVWRAAFGNTAGGTGSRAAVPEPATGLLLLLGIGYRISGRRRPFRR
jgi:hypothetical protein